MTRRTSSDPPGIRAPVALVVALSLMLVTGAAIAWVAFSAGRDWARRVEPRTPAERAAMLASGDCVVARGDGRVLGKLGAFKGHRSRWPADRYNVVFLDVRTGRSVKKDRVRLVPCASIPDSVLARRRPDRPLDALR
jgi:Flp pilus assembly protein CpaB